VNMSERGRAIIFIIVATIVGIVAVVFMNSSSSTTQSSEETPAPASSPSPPPTVAPPGVSEIEDVLPVDAGRLASLKNTATEATRVATDPTLTSSQMNEQLRGLLNSDTSLVAAPGSLQEGEREVVEDTSAVGPPVTFERFVSLTPSQVTVEVVAGESTYTYSFERSGSWAVVFMSADNCAANVPCPVAYGLD
jgi:hypothetical protein